MLNYLLLCDLSPQLRDDVGFLIESVHGAGSSVAKKIVFNRLYHYEMAGGDCQVA